MWLRLAWAVCCLLAWWLLYPLIFLAACAALAIQQLGLMLSDALG